MAAAQQAFIHAYEYLNEARHLRRSGKWRDSVDMLEEGLAIHGHDEDLMLEFAIACSSTFLTSNRPGLDFKAHDCFARVYDANPFNSKLLNEYGRFKSKLGDYKHAEDLFIELIDLEGFTFKNLTSLGDVYQKHGICKKEREDAGKYFSYARGCFGKSLELQPDDPTSMRRLEEMEKKVAPGILYSPEDWQVTQQRIQLVAANTIGGLRQEIPAFVPETKENR